MQRTPTSCPRYAPMHSSSSGRRRSATSLRNPCSSGKPRVTTLPSTPIGRQAVISGFTARLRSVIVVTTVGPAVAEALEVVAGGVAAAPADGSGTRAGRARGHVAACDRRGVGRRLGRRGWGSPEAAAGVHGGRGAGSSGGRGLGGAGRGGASRRRRGGGRAPGVATAPAPARAGRRGGAAAARGPARAGRARSWRRRPPGPRRVGSMPARRRAAAAMPGSAAPPAARSASSCSRSASTTWSRKTRRSRPRSSSRSSRAMPGRRVPAASAATKPSTSSASARPEQVAHRVGLDPARRRAEQLVEDRLRVAHAAGGEAGDRRGSPPGPRRGRRPPGSARACR